MNWDVLYDSAVGGENGKEILKNIINGKYGAVYTTDYILIKVIDKLVLAQKKAIAAQLLTILYGGIEEEKLGIEEKPQLTDKVSVLKVEKTNVEEARRWFFQHQLDSDIDFIDWSTISLMKDKKDEQILAYDACFDTVKEYTDVTLPRVSRIAIRESMTAKELTTFKEPKQLMGAKWLFAVGIVSLVFLPVLALVAGFLKIGVPDVVYVSLAIVAVAFVIASVFGKKAAMTAVKKLSK